MPGLDADYWQAGVGHSLNSHCDRGPASSPIRASRQAGSWSTRARSSGWLGAFSSRQIEPISSTIQIEVSLTSHYEGCLPVGAALRLTVAEQVRVAGD